MKRTAHDDAKDTERLLAETVLRLGEAHGAVSVAEDVSRTAHELAAAHPCQSATRAFAAATLELPHKAGLAAALVAAVAAESPEAATALVQAVFACSETQTTAGTPVVVPWRRVYALAGFATLLAVRGVLRPETYAAFADAWATHAEARASAGDMPTAACLCWSLLTAAMALDGERRAATPGLARLACLYASHGGDVSAWARPPVMPVCAADAVALDVDASLGLFAVDTWEAPSTLLRALPWPDVAKGSTTTPADADRIDTVPGDAASVDGPFHADAAQWERDAAVASMLAIVHALRDNHRRCAEVMLAVGAGLPGVALPERLVVGVLLTGILRASAVSGGADLPSLVYETLLVDCCRIAPRAVPAAMAKTLNMLLRTPAGVPPLTLPEADRLAQWFALHLCTFELRWAWPAWTDLLGAEAHPAGSLFVRALLSRLLGLSYMGRVRGTLPDAFRAVLAAVAAVSSVSVAGADAAGTATLAALLAQRVPPEDVAAALETLDARGPTLWAALLQVGVESPSRLQALLERHVRILRAHTTPADAPAVLAALFAQCRGPALAMAVERAVNYRVLAPAAVCAWLCALLSPDAPTVDGADAQGLPAESALSAWLTGIVRANMPAALVDVLRQTRELVALAEDRASAAADDDERAHMLRAVATLSAEHLAAVREALAGLARVAASSVDAPVAAMFAAQLFREVALEHVRLGIQQTDVTSLVPDAPAALLALLQA